jgi:hypothetical protein
MVPPTSRRIAKERINQGLMRGDLTLKKGYGKRLSLG